MYANCPSFLYLWELEDRHVPICWLLQHVTAIRLFLQIGVLFVAVLITIAHSHVGSTFRHLSFGNSHTASWTTGRSLSLTSSSACGSFLRTALERKFVASVSLSLGARDFRTVQVLTITAPIRIPFKQCLNCLWNPLQRAKAAGPWPFRASTLRCTHVDSDVKGGFTWRAQGEGTV